MRAIHKKRLLNVAKALRESEKPKDFNMSRFMNSCGTPACALGHYAVRRDLQRFFRTGTSLGMLWVLYEGTGEPVRTWIYDDVDNEPARDHFGITGPELLELFGSDGCGDAQTAKQAARYIERFVKRKERDAKAVSR